MSDKIFIQNLIHYIQSYIKDCYICQLTHKEKPPTRQLQTRINLNHKPLSRLGMDLKVMPISYKGYKFIVCVTDEVMNYLMTVPICSFKSEEIGDTLIENVVTKYCIPEYIRMD